MGRPTAKKNQKATIKEVFIFEGIGLLLRSIFRNVHLHIKRLVLLNTENATISFHKS